jgi:methyl-accepting chemotaxis protein-1 (serine sensor receptor)
MLSNLRIGMRLRVVVIVQCALMIGVALTGLSGIGESKGRLHDIYEDSIVPLLYLDSLLSQNLQAREQLDEALSADTPAKAEKHLDRVAGFRADAEKAWKDYVATPMSPEEKKLADEAAQAYLRLVAARDEVISAFKAHGRAAAADVDKRAERAVKFDRWRAAVDKLIEHQARDAESGYKAADGDYAQAKWAVVAVLLLGVGFAAVVSWLVIRSLTRPLEIATGIARRIAGGV